MRAAGPGPARVCCSPCLRRNFCSLEAACCLECHMAFEEKHAGPLLPPVLANRLAAEHRDLARRGFPPKEVREHSVREERIFRHYLSRPENEIVLRQILDDHEHWERGQLHSRAEGGV